MSKIGSLNKSLINIKLISRFSNTFRMLDLRMVIKHQLKTDFNHWMAQTHKNNMRDHITILKPGERSWLKLKLSYCCSKVREGEYITKINFISPNKMPLSYPPVSVWGMMGRWGDYSLIIIQTTLVSYLPTKDFDKAGDFPPACLSLPSWVDKSDDAYPTHTYGWAIKWY